MIAVTNALASESLPKYLLLRASRYTSGYPYSPLRVKDAVQLLYLPLGQKEGVLVELLIIILHIPCLLRDLPKGRNDSDKRVTKFVAPLV